MKKIIGILLTVALLLSTMMGCGSPDAASDGTGENDPAGGSASGTTKTDLVVTTYTDPKNLNPFQIEGRQAQRINFQIFERLVNQGEEPGTYEGMLAESWEFDEDGLGITMNLRQGVKFHNGQEMTAEDVQFSMEYAGTQASASGGFDWIMFDSVEIIDDYTVHIPFSYECSLTLSALAANNLNIVCKDVFEEYGSEVGLHPVGTGPFMLADSADWVLDSSLKLTRFDDYWGNAPKLETINFKFITESSQAMIELETGNADLVLDVPALSYESIESSSDFKLLKFDSVVGDYIHFNCSKPPFDDVRVRQAVAYAINQADIRRAVYLDQADILFSAITPAIFGYIDEFEGDNWPYGYDNANIEKAKELLAEAGYPDGFTVDFLIDDNSDRVAVAEVVKNQLEAVGIHTNLSSMDYASWYQKLVAGEVDIFLNGINAQTGEPDRCMYLRWHSNCIEPGTNMTKYSNPEFDELLTRARTTYDDQEKLECYAEAQRLWVEELPSIPYIVRNHIYASKSNLQGLRAYGEACFLFDVYFE